MRRGTSATCRSRPSARRSRRFYQQGGDGSRTDQFIGDLTPDEDRYTFNALFTYEITTAARVFADLKYSRTEAFTESQPSFDFFLFLEPDYAFTPPNIAAAAAAAGDSSLLVSRDHFDLGIRGEDIERDTRRVVVGVDGEIAAGTRYEVSLVYGETEVNNLQTNNRLNDRFAAALDAVVDPVSGDIVCRSNLDPSAVPVQSAMERLGWFRAAARHVGGLVHAGARQRLRTGQHPGHECSVARGGGLDHDRQPRVLEDRAVRRHGIPDRRHCRPVRAARGADRLGGGRRVPRGEEQEHPGGGGPGRAHVRQRDAAGRRQVRRVGDLRRGEHSAARRPAVRGQTQHRWCRALLRLQHHGLGDDLEGGPHLGTGVRPQAHRYRRRGDARAEHRRVVRPGRPDFPVHRRPVRRQQPERGHGVPRRKLRDPVDVAWRRPRDLRRSEFREHPRLAGRQPGARGRSG